MKLGRKVKNFAKRTLKREAKRAVRTGVRSQTGHLWFLPMWVRYVVALMGVLAVIQPWNYTDFIPNPTTCITSMIDNVKSSVSEWIPSMPDLGFEEVGTGTVSVDTYEELAKLEYTGDQYVTVNNNTPFFSQKEREATEAFESYSELDHLGRTGQASAYLTQELMPTEDRESLSSVYPSGWEQNEYEHVDGGYLYNRCHLIAFALAGEQANPNNLMTGTRSMNVSGMLVYEEQLMEYVDNGGEVLYRVTPIYNGDNLLASGVLMEAASEDINFSVYVHNVEPGVEINYATGENQ